ncbi:hypothetical protein IL306_004292 [Fusarium sp. DS 682]|nr:hypothetical protein IL306_004292 [Fusarium sp. DS 682]
MSTRSTPPIALGCYFRTRTLDNMETFMYIDLELVAWPIALPQCCQYAPLKPLDLKRGHAVATSHLTQETSRLRVRDASIYITRMALELHQFHLDMFLPITDVAIVLAAMVTHLLNMQNPVLQCMCVMKKLREIYIAVDDAIGFLHAALRKAGVDTNEPATAEDITHKNIKLAEPIFGTQTPTLDNDIDLKNSDSMPSAITGSEELGPLDLHFSGRQGVLDSYTAIHIDLDIDQWL